MEKKSKSDIKKMIADLHAKKNGSDSAKNQPIEQASGGKSTKGASINKTYRPKI